MTHPLSRLFASSNDAILRNLLKGAGFAVALRAFGAILALILNVAIGRLLGPEGAGLYYLGLAVCTLSAVVVRLGIDQALLRQISTFATRREWGRAVGLFHRGFVTVAATAILAALLIALTAPLLADQVFGKPRMSEILISIAPCIVTFALMTVVAESLKGLSRFKDAMLVSGVIYPAVALVAIWPLATTLGASGAVFSYFLGTLSAVGWGLVVWRRHVKSYAVSTVYEGRDLWSVSSKLWVMALVSNALLPWGPILLLGAVGTSIDTGLFGAALRLSVVISFFHTAAYSVVAPTFARLIEAGDFLGLQRVACRFSLVIFGLSAPFIFAMILAGESIMGLFGGEFVEGALALQILAVGQGVNVLIGAVGLLLMMSGHERDIRNASFFSAVVLLLASLSLIPPYGSVGAAIASVLTLLSSLAFNFFLVKKRLGFYMFPR